jgi:NADH:ubiquinone oxidoreductase subunit 4 (subunit M)
MLHYLTTALIGLYFLLGGIGITQSIRGKNTYILWLVVAGICLILGITCGVKDSINQSKQVNKIAKH